jgi:hypothetical protein
MGQDKWIVGAEYDDALFARLGKALGQLGCRQKDKRKDFF